MASKTTSKKLMPMEGITTATVGFSFRAARALPAGLGVYFISLATFRIRAFFSDFTLPRLFSTLSTVPLDTPHKSAISLIVTTKSPPQFRYFLPDFHRNFSYYYYTIKLCSGTVNKKQKN